MHSLFLYLLSFPPPHCNQYQAHFKGGETKKSSPEELLPMFYVTKSIYPYRLRKTDCLIRANICTSTTLCAHVWVDRILLALRDSSSWALINTCTASDTIVTNYVSHNNNFYNVNNVSVSHVIGYTYFVWCKDNNYFSNTYN